MHHVKCAYVNSSEKVRQLLFFMYKVKSLTAEAAAGKALVVNELMEKVEVTISTEFLRLRKFAKGHCSTETNAADNLSGCDMSSGYAYTLISFGFSTQCSLTLIAASGIILQVDGDYRSIEKLTYLQTIFPTFRHHLIS
ncbi:unnamed protein product [Sphagnum troendelagicum]